MPKKLAVFLLSFASCLLIPSNSFADGNLQNVKHVIIVMQENHAFDNYFGVLSYAPNSPYHSGIGITGCSPSDHKCVNGLTCAKGLRGDLLCGNSNRDANNSIVHSFHATTRCLPDLDHSWYGTHREVNFFHPNDTLAHPLDDGFVLQNDITGQIPNRDPLQDRTMSYYDQTDLPFYYGLAQTFAMSDSQFSSVLGPTFPNRSYLMAATSFGHLTTNDIIPPSGGYKPITGTFFDLLDRNGVSWADFFQDVPQAASFRVDGHSQPLAIFYLEASGIGTLPDVSFIDPNFGTFGYGMENDEHPPTDIQRGQYFVSQVINAVRNGPHWKDTIIFLAFDEHGGFYDHAKPPRAPQGGALNPDGINPGQCEDLSDPPLSEQPGYGAECSTNLVSDDDTSLKDAEQLCPALTRDPHGLYPLNCANFNQLGGRIPFIAISPFSKPTYVSHTVGDHTSMLALIEKRWMNGQHLTKRDQYANTLEDLFDFDHSPSLNSPVGQAQPPQHDCTPAQ